MKTHQRNAWEPSKKNEAEFVVSIGREITSKGVGAISSLDKRKN